MVYKLQCLAQKDRGIYVIRRDEEVLTTKVFRVYSDPGEKLKKRTLEVLIKGLLGIKDVLRYEDLCIVELENQHLIKWLRTSKEYKGYASLKTVIDLIDNLPCQVKIEQANLRSLSKEMHQNVLDTKEYSIDDLVSQMDFEEDEDEL